MTTANYLDGRFKYARPQAVLWSNNPGTISQKVIASFSTTTDLLFNGYTIDVTNTPIPTTQIAIGDLVIKTGGTGGLATNAKVKSLDLFDSLGRVLSFSVTAPHTISGDLDFDIRTNMYIPDGDELGLNGATDGDFLILSDHNRSALDFATERIEVRERMVNGRMRSYHIADKLKLDISWDMLPSRSHKSRPNFSSVGASDIYQYTADGGAGGVELLNWYENNPGSFWVFLSYDKYNNFGSDDSAYRHLNQYSQIMEMFIADFNYSVEKRGATNHDMWNVSVTLEEA